jgi:hypothetical protein
MGLDGSGLLLAAVTVNDNGGSSAPEPNERLGVYSSHELATTGTSCSRCDRVLFRRPLRANAQRRAHQWRVANEQQILHEFTDLLSILNVASDTSNIRRNADTLVEALARRRVAAKLLLAPGANPVVYGEIKTPGAKHTIVFYAHYDGQPVTPEEWESKTPFTPLMRMVDGEPRIYARSSSDDKAAIIAQLTALDALQAAHIPLKANLGPPAFLPN